MRLEYRLRRLERSAGGGVSRCETCGGPSPGVNLFVALNEDSEPRWGRCVCGLALDQDGRPCAAVPRLVEGVMTVCKEYAPGASVEAV